MIKKWKVKLYTLASCLMLTGSLAQADVVKIDGSSTVYPITEAVAEEFQKAKRGAVKITVGISGTGGGFKKFCRGETDISDASRPIKTQEMKACREKDVEYIEIPVAFDAITVVVNPRNNWVSSLTGVDLRKMWEPVAQRRITRWNQVRSAWPNAPLALYGPGADSGTFDYFTAAIVGKSKSSRGDYTASEDDNVLVPSTLARSDPGVLAKSDPFGARQHCTKFRYRSARAYQGPKELTLSNLEA